MESFQGYFSVDAIWVYLREGVVSLPLLIVIAWALFFETRVRGSGEPVVESTTSPAQAAHFGG